MRSWIGAVAALALLGAAPDDAAKPFRADEFLIIPLRVHVLSADDLPEIDCKLSDDDVRRIVGKVNRVWGRAGIHWGLEAIVREPAANQGRFRAMRALAGDAPFPLGRLRDMMPAASRGEDGLDVYFVHEFAVNGVYLGDRAAFVQETATLREVEGGIDEHVPRVTAHELAHALGLPHRQARTNLLASGTTGTTLNDDEVAQARAGARLLPGHRRVEEVRAALKGDLPDERADALRRWLDEIERVLNASASTPSASRSPAPRVPSSTPAASSSAPAPR